ncbi:hypothetical protein FPZ12_010465 [Amycolatopsis acidicola]|uniref:Mce-associated membrane protein n=1 Tax=Amycolatopsis acidicola TaxID=2596893 RepID=A0A5N0VBN4_9PSEU|nr:hypothetical protein [Amycolatopsis acidicola]KAA9162934.1 hypothetical protein FPZ12_010465 [Amycolatopsis acidicola]
MPSSSPRRPQQPGRRPKVAGLRRPSPSPRPKPDQEAPADVVESPSAPEVEDTAAASETTVEETPAEAVEAPEVSEDTVEELTRPSPRPKSRDTGAPKPDDFYEAEAAVAEPDPELSVAEPEKRERSPRSRFVLAGALFGAALVLAGFAVWFKIEGNQLDAATSNTALLDVARTSQVNQAATNAAETLFSYDFNNIAKTQNAAKDLLLNDEVKAKYDSLMGEVERLAPQQKIVVTVKASRSAVVRLEGDLARVMVFVDQTATRTDQNQTSSGSAQLYMNMQYVDGKWKVSNLNTYSAETPTSTPSASGSPAPTTSAPPASPSR